MPLYGVYLIVSSFKCAWHTSVFWPILAQWINKRNWLIRLTLAKELKMNSATRCTLPDYATVQYLSIFKAPLVVLTVQRGAHGAKDSKKEPVLRKPNEEDKIVDRAWSGDKQLPLEAKNWDQNYSYLKRISRWLLVQTPNVNTLLFIKV